METALVVERTVEPGRSRRERAAKRCKIDKGILDNLGRLAATRGDATEARKAEAEGRLTESEKNWIKAALRQLIRNVGEVDTPALSQLALSDLPPLE